MFYYVSNAFETTGFCQKSVHVGIPEIPSKGVFVF